MGPKGVRLKRLDCIKFFKVVLRRKLNLSYQNHFKTYTSYLYEKKNAVYYFKISPFVLEIFKFSPFQRLFKFLFRTLFLYFWGL